MFLDPRTNPLLTLSQKKAAREFIMQLTKKQEKTVAKQTKNKRKTVDEAFLEEIEGDDDPAPLKSPLDEELIAFIRLLNAPDKIREPLEFWTAHSRTLPILFRIAKRILAISPCSTDAERFFSSTGHICSDSRPNLAPQMVNILASMNSWLRDLYGYRKSKRQQKSAASSARFAILSIDLELISGIEEEDLEQDSDDESDAEE